MKENQVIKKLKELNKEISEVDKKLNRFIGDKLDVGGLLRRRSYLIGERLGVLETCCIFFEVLPEFILKEILWGVK